jgi:hypothetical protein
MGQSLNRSTVLGKKKFGGIKRNYSSVKKKFLSNGNLSYSMIQTTGKPTSTRNKYQVYKNLRTNLKKGKKSQLSNTFDEMRSKHKILLKKHKK